MEQANGSVLHVLTAKQLVRYEPLARRTRCLAPAHARCGWLQIIMVSVMPALDALTLPPARPAMPANSMAGQERQLQSFFAQNVDITKSRCVGWMRASFVH